MEESLDVSAQNPEIVAMLNRFAAEARADMGDALTKTEGSGNRKVGRQSQH